MTGTWAELTDARIPGRRFQGVVWTGDEVVVWGGDPSRPGEPLGVAYRPDTGEWRALPQGPLGPRWGHLTVWTGEEVVIWGGTPTTGGDEAVGGAYHPETDTWREMAKAPIEARTAAIGIWTGEEMLVWGGEGGPAFTGAAYDPGVDRWREIARAPVVHQPSLFGSIQPGVWTGTELIVGGAIDVRESSTWAAYDPEGNRWRQLPGSPLGPRWGHSAVWTGEEMIIWGGGGEAHPAGAAYDPLEDRWRELPAPPVIQRQGHATVWTGRHMIVWGGHPIGPIRDVGERLGVPIAYAPGEDRWMLVEAPGRAVAARAVWTGEAVIVVEDGGEAGLFVLDH